MVQVGVLVVLVVTANTWELPVAWHVGRRHRAPGTKGHAYWVEGLEPICAGLISGAALMGIGNAIVNVLMN